MEGFLEADDARVADVGAVEEGDEVEEGEPGDEAEVEAPEKAAVLLSYLSLALALPVYAGVEMMLWQWRVRGAERSTRETYNLRPLLSAESRVRVRRHSILIQCMNGSLLMIMIRVGGRAISITIRGLRARAVEHVFQAHSVLFLFYYGRSHVPSLACDLMERGEGGRRSSEQVWRKR